MPELTIHAGICGFVTTIRAASTDQQTVKTPHETSVYAALEEKQ